VQELGVRFKEFALDQGPEILIESAFGIGGRDLAAEALSGWRQKMEKR
jgi:hypothetical protein